MAQVIRRDDADHLVARRLQYLLDFWRTVPEFAAEWPEWDDYSQTDFIVEWPLMREAYSRVARAASKGTLDASQLRDWAELQRLMAMYTPTVEEMLGHPV
jgi:hypothetical protein